MLEIFRRGDKVRTPLKRLAMVVQTRGDGRYDLQYLDQDCGQVALSGEQLELVKRAPLRKAA